MLCRMTSQPIFRSSTGTTWLWFKKSVTRRSLQFTSCLRSATKTMATRLESWWAADWVELRPLSTTATSTGKHRLLLAPWNAYTWMQVMSIFFIGQANFRQLIISSGMLIEKTIFSSDLHLLWGSPLWIQVLSRVYLSINNPKATEKHIYAYM